MTDNDRSSIDGSPLASVRAILLRETQEHIQQLEQQIAALQQRGDLHEEEQQTQIAQLQAELAELEQRALTDPEKITHRLTPMMTNLVRRTIVESPDEMAEVLGPVMGEAVRVQIRDSRETMIDALYPIIGSTVQKFISQFASELQRNIDVRLKSAFGPQGILRALLARLRGVSAAKLALRDALPFHIQELFLIQHGSGMLLAHSHPGSSEVVDSDLVSAMLTAIRDFGRDAFSKGQELDEVQYGDQRIIIESSKVFYLAIVIEGVEPEGFRGRLHQFVADLHAHFGNALRDYDGDPENLPNLQPWLAKLVLEAGAAAKEETPKKRTVRQRLFLLGGVAAFILLVSLACFYLRFTLALLPVAFPGPTATYTATFTPTATATATATATPTPSPTETPTPTPTLTISPTVTYTATPQPTQTFVPTPTPYRALLIGYVWIYEEPRLGARTTQLVVKDTPVIVLAVQGEWAKIEWVSEHGVQQGWVLLRWLSLLEPIPTSLITPIQ